MHTMTQQQIGRYLALTQSVQDLPGVIAQAEAELTERKMALVSEKRMLDDIGESLVDEAILKAGGIKEFGSSEDIRKANAKRLKASNRQYVQQEKIVDACELDVQRQTELISDVTRQYGAICFQITHHAGLLNYLASAGAPSASYTWDLPVNATANAMSGDVISTADLETIGL